MALLVRYVNSITRIGRAEHPYLASVMNDYC